MLHPTVSLAQAVAKIRKAHPANASFGKALEAAGHGDLGANDRSALLRIAQLDPVATSTRLWASRYDRAPPQYQWRHDLAHAEQPAEAKKPTVTLYHSCPPETARRILAEGFRNRRGHYTPDHAWQGVLFSTMPETLKGRVLLGVTLLAGAPCIGAPLYLSRPWAYHLIDATLLRGELLGPPFRVRNPPRIEVLAMEPCEACRLDKLATFELKKEGLAVLRDQTLSADQRQERLSSLAQS